MELHYGAVTAEYFLFLEELDLTALRRWPS